MLKASIAILIAATTPALAANTVVFRHEVKFQDQTFICGEIKSRGKFRDLFTQFLRRNTFRSLNRSRATPWPRVGR